MKKMFISNVGEERVWKQDIQDIQDIQDNWNWVYRPSHVLVSKNEIYVIPYHSVKFSIFTWCNLIIKKVLA